MGKIIIINSHPIQYFAPLYSFLYSKGIDLEVWYCSDENVKGHFDKGFNVNVKWDVDLLAGYPHKFFPNRKNGSLQKGFFGLVNITLLKAIIRLPANTVVWVHGWAYFTQLFSVFIAAACGKEVWLRGESPLNQELIKTGLRKKLLSIFQQYVYFPVVDKFLYIGHQNYLFYKHYGIADKKLFFVPYSVDNSRFRNDYFKYREDRSAIKKTFGLPTDRKIILFSAKYIPKKRPLDLIKAFEKLSNRDKFHLVLVGDGILRETIEKYITNHNITNVTLTGFINQSEITKYYTVADLFVMCSDAGETWGLATNEAMNFNLPLVLSDMCGCAYDLVNNSNGIIFKTGDVQGLRDAIENVSRHIDRDNCSSQKVVEQYSYEVIHSELLKQLNRE